MKFEKGIPEYKSEFLLLQATCLVKKVKILENQHLNKNLIRSATGAYVVYNK